MRHKFAILDRCAVLTSSSNWPTDSEENNYDQLVALDDPLTVEAGQRKFEALGETARPGKSGKSKAREHTMPARQSEGGKADTSAAENSGEFELYLMRHGLAVARGDSGFPDDVRRPLTPDGRKKMREIARGLVKLGWAVDAVVTSPLVRAVETAEAVMEALVPRVPLEKSDALRPGGSAEALIASLAARPDRKRVLLVGHEPSLSELAARLVGAGRNANFAFKKGGCCLITFDQFPPKSAGQLVWWLTPKVMKKIG